jgi:hypothetical protein
VVAKRNEDSNRESDRNIFVKRQKLRSRNRWVGASLSWSATIPAAAPYDDEFARMHLAAWHANKLLDVSS